MGAEVVEIDIIPGLIVPAVCLLDVLAEVVAVDMESDVGVELTDDRFPVDVYGALL